jgi:ABC-type transporter Mla subunit MlaD
MKTKTNYFLLGLFVIAGLVAVVAGVLYFGASTFASRGLVVESYFAESVQGLEKGALVRFRGVRIGVVTDIRLASQTYATDRPYALVRALLDPTEVGLTERELRARLEERIRQGYRVRLASQGLTGALYLETDLVSDPAQLAQILPIDWEPDFVRVPSVPSTIARMGASVEEVLGSLQRTDFPGLVDDARAALQAVTGAVGALDAPGFRQRFDGLADNLDLALGEARTSIDRLGDRASALLERGQQIADAIEPAAVGRTVAAFADLAASLPESRARLDALLDEAAAASAELRGEARAKGRDLDLILGELRRVTSHFAGLAETLERYPSLMLLGNPPPRTEPGR